MKGNQLLLRNLLPSRKVGFNTIQWKAVSRENKTILRWYKPQQDETPQETNYK